MHHKRGQVLLVGPQETSSTLDRAAALLGSSVKTGAHTAVHTRHLPGYTHHTCQEITRRCLQQPQSQGWLSARSPGATAQHSQGSRSPNSDLELSGAIRPTNPCTPTKTLPPTPHKQTAHQSQGPGVQLPLPKPMLGKKNLLPVVLDTCAKTVAAAVSTAMATAAPHVPVCLSTGRSLRQDHRLEHSASLLFSSGRFHHASTPLRAYTTRSNDARVHWVQHARCGELVG